MRLLQRDVIRVTSRVLPASVLSVAVLTGLGGSLVATSPVVPNPASERPGTTTTAEVPGEAIQMPASVTRASYTTVGARSRIVTASSATTTRSIPPAALAAYQRAVSVINASDPSCGLDWELLAAIGRVESDHGNHGNSSLDANGVARPAIIGAALDGRGTQRIDDTDAGQLDGDTTHDRAVGPLQFIPSTWAMVGVDADGDGLRNPQDIDDAALGAAVYLCSGDDDLSTESGRRSAVLRYNHSQSYVTIVLDLMHDYVQGHFSSTPTSTSVSAAVTVDSRLVGTAATKTRSDASASGSQAARGHRWMPKVERDRSLASGGGTAAPTHESAFQDPAVDPEAPEETTDPAETTDPDETATPTEPEPTEPEPTEPEPTEPAPTDPSEPTGSDDPTPSGPTTPPADEPTLVPSLDGLCPVVDPETDQVLDATTGEPVLDPETGDPLTVEDLADYVDAEGNTCAAAVDQPEGSDGSSGPTEAETSPVP